MAFMNRKLLFFTLITIIGLSALFPAYANLIRNSSFETGGNTRITDWQTHVRNNGHAEFKITGSIAHSGSRALAIINNEKETAACSQVVEIEGGKVYRFSCWIKTELAGVNPAVGGAYLSVNNNPETSVYIAGFSKEWERAELYIESEITDDAEINNLINKIVLHLNLRNIDGPNTGVAYFDDAVLEEVAGVPENVIISRINAGIPAKTAGNSEGEGTDTAARERERQTLTVVVLLVAVIALFISGRALHRVFRKRVKIRVISHNSNMSRNYIFRFPAVKQHRLNRIRNRKYSRMHREKRITADRKKIPGKNSNLE